MVLFVVAQPAARGLVWLGGYGALPISAALYGALVAWALGAPLRAAAGRAGRGGAPFFAALTLLAGAWLPAWALVAGALALGVVTAEDSAGATADDARRKEHTGAGLAVTTGTTFVLLLVTLAAWALARPALDPTPLGFTVLVGAGLVGAACARGRWTVAPALAILGAAGWVVATRLDDVLARGAHGGLLVYAAGGVAAGLLVGGVRPPVRALAPAALVAALLLTPLLALTPPSMAAWSARAATSTWPIRDRVAALRARATLVAAHVGAAGSTALHRVDEHVLAELDGSFADPDTRAGSAERFVGSLAACATPGRARARVGGDDLGLAVDALRAQGFLAVDTAVPDGGFTRAQAGARPALARTWLHPSVRLVPLPAPAVLRAGGRADAVVEIVRAPWTDGRRTVPRARELAATRAGLAPEGVHALALAATGLPDGALLAAIADFRAVYPAASLWLPPEGADTALLLGPASDAALPWAGFERCVAADRDGFRALSLATAVDVGALALADATSLAALPAGRRLGPGLPSTLHAAPGLALTGLPALTAEPARLFAGAPSALAERAEGRALFLELLREATSGDVKDAMERARALAATPGGARALDPLLKPHLDRARRAMARGAREGVGSKAWDEAETALATARALAPGQAATRCLEGELAGARGQLSRAEEAFAACAEADPGSLDAHEGLARARRSRGNLPGAEEALRAALRARPDAWTASHNLGVFLVELGRYDEAERLLKQAAASQSREGGALAPAPYLALARVYLATDRAELALAQAERAVGLGGAADALALRGAARLELRQPDMAEEDFRAALAVAPTHVLARGGLGQLQAVRGEYELATASFRAVLEADPQNAAARENLRRLARLAREAE